MPWVRPAAVCVALPPDNTAHTWILSGSARLPADFPNRVTGSLAYGIRSQSDDFLPHTINSAIVSPGLVLPDGDLDGKVHTILGNLVASARPIENLSVELRGRVYNYNNKTGRLIFPEHVTTDTTLDTSPIRSVYTDYLTASGELEGAYDVMKGMTAHLGYGFDYWNRNSTREVENLWEHGPAGPAGLPSVPQLAPADGLPVPVPPRLVVRHLQLPLRDASPTTRPPRLRSFSRPCSASSTRPTATATAPRSSPA